MDRSPDREAEIFNAARLLPASQRASYLAMACADDAALRQQVEELLQAGEEAREFLGAPAPEAATARAAHRLQGSAAAEKPGDRIGHYTLLQQLGEGGCGIVYLAEQHEPVRRRVALKIIKLGMDTRQVVARFEAERQALALMDHPHIAKVFDAGATDTGRPFFVMELVRGVRITDYCDQNLLSTPERLDLFIQICQAVQHAHQKGVIHRDLKPSNILVSANDGVAVPKVIDFGIAKATQGRLTDQTVFTAFEQFIGTPAYMSPEQAMITSVDIDTRTDIYTLGVLLYELLTGKTTFDATQLLAVGPDEMRRTICEREPVRPSTRLSTMRGVDLETTARYRQADPPKLLHLVRGDLDWIVMKCLEKDRARRYETANGLALDVERHLRDEPVVARPPSRTYRLAKLVRRHKLVFGAAGTVAAALISGIAVSTWLFVQERQAHEKETAWRMAAEQSDHDASVASARAQTAAEKLRRNLETSDLVQAVHLIAADNCADALAYLARILSTNPTNDAALTRMTTLLTYRSWMIPTLILRHSNVVSSAQFSPDGTRIVTDSSDYTARVWDAQSGLPVTSPLRHNHIFESGRSVGFSPDGCRVVTASFDRTARVWDAQRGIPLTGPMQHDGAVWSARFSPDGTRIITASEDGKARVWDAQSGVLLLMLKHAESVISAEFSPDGKWLATASLDKTARVWDAQTGLPRTPPLQHEREVRVARFSPDSQRIVTASYDGTARVWDARDGRPLTRPLPHGDKVRSAQFSPDGKWLLTASYDHTARLWDAESGLPLGDPLKHGKLVMSAEFSPDGQRVVTASWDETARVWDAPSGHPLTEFFTHGGSLSGACFSPDGRRIVTASYDGTARVWEPRNRPPPGLTFKHSATVYRGQFSLDGKRIVTASDDKTARVWDALTGQPITEPLEHRALVNAVQFSSDGLRVLTASGDHTACVWDAQTGRSLLEPFKHGGPVNAAQFSPDGSLIVTASDDKTARVWDARTGLPVVGPLQHSAPVSSASFSPDGLRIVTGANDGTVRVWGAHNGRLLAECSGHRGAISAAQFSPDGMQVVTASDDGTAQVWDAQNGRPVTGPLLHGSHVGSAQFSPDGRRVLTASWDQKARVWDAQTGHLLIESLNHASGLTFAQFSPDGRRIVTTSDDYTACVWDAQTGQPLTDSLRHNGNVWFAQFSPDGKRLVTASVDRTARIWDLAPSASTCPHWLLPLAEAISGKVLNEQGFLRETKLDRPQVLAQLRDQLSAAPDNDDWVQWGRWFLADPDTRTVSPFSTITPQDYDKH